MKPWRRSLYRVCGERKRNLGTNIYIFTCKLCTNNIKREREIERPAFIEFEGKLLFSVRVYRVGLRS